MVIRRQKHGPKWVIPLHIKKGPRGTSTAMFDPGTEGTQREPGSETRHHGIQNTDQVASHQLLAAVEATIIWAPYHTLWTIGLGQGAMKGAGWIDSGRA